MENTSYSPEDINIFKQQALQWACSFTTACCFDSNNFADKYSSFDFLICADIVDELEYSGDGAFEKLGQFLQDRNTWLPGFLSYDLKNSVEALSSSNTDNLNLPDLYFFVPKHILIFRGTTVTLIADSPASIIKEIQNISLKNPETELVPEIKKRFSREEYIETVNQIRDHISKGDIYELNFCQEFYIEDIQIDPLSLFRSLSRISPTPFSVFFKLKDKYIISASPERYLRREGFKLISQPIKGTIKRGADEISDQTLKEALLNDLKERSENVMIVDLVRNDLTKCSEPGSVAVEELFGIYSFRQVHQMISTVVSKSSPAYSNSDVLKATFPMGSMTGAPKIRAMQLIEKYERSKRGVFSGAVGYFSPENDFDFNVVIRTILYHKESGYLSFQVGSAITFASDPIKEYEECMVKAKAILQALRVVN